MARKTYVGPDEIQKAERLRDHAASIGEYRKALSVLLVAGLWV